MFVAANLVSIVFKHLEPDQNKQRTIFFNVLVVGQAADMSTACKTM